MGDDTAASWAYYRAHGVPRWVLLGGGAMFTTVAVVGLGTVLLGYLTGDPPAESAFFVIWCVIALLLCAVYLGPTAVELALVNDELLWQPPLLSGHLDLAGARCTTGSRWTQDACVGDVALPHSADGSEVSATAADGGRGRRDRTLERCPRGPAAASGRRRRGAAPAWSRGAARRLPPRPRRPRRPARRPRQRPRGRAGRRAAGHAHRPRGPGGRAALGRRPGRRGPSPARLGRPRRGGADVAGRLLGHLDPDAAADDAAGLGVRPRAEPADTPYRVPAPLLPWLDVVTAPAGSRLEQGPSQRHRTDGFDDWETDPSVTERVYDRAGSWSLLDPSAGPVRTRGRLLGGCVETISTLAGTPYGDVPRFAAEHAGDEGLLLHLEAGGDTATDIARHLWRMRLAGWFDVAAAVLVGRTTAPDSGGFTQHDAVRSALAGLDVPVVLDVDCGHTAPQLALVDGAHADLVVDPGADERTLVQHLA